MQSAMVWLLVVLQGCSFIVTTMPDAPRKPGSCTGHAAWSIAPAIDAAVIGAIRYRRSQLEEHPDEQLDTIGIFVFAISAVKGILAIANCRCATKRADYDKAHH